MEPLFLINLKQIIYLEPNKLYQYLFQYNQNSILKSTCHEIDSNEIETIKDYIQKDEYDFELHLKKIIDEFKVHNQKYFAPKFIYALIWRYLTGPNQNDDNNEKGWSSDEIKIYWGHQIILDYTSEHKFTPPNLSKELLRTNRIRPCQIEQINSKITGKSIQTFREIVIHFKNLFHIRYDNSLHNLLKKQNELKEYNQKVNFSIDELIFPHNIELFTDVDKLLQAYIRIIDLIIDKHSSKEQIPSVKLSFSQNESKIYLSIHHLNSIYKKSVLNTIERIGSTYKNLIKHQINGICNLYLKADFGNNEFAEINIWCKNQKREIKPLEIFEGVEHILEFEKSEL